MLETAELPLLRVLGREVAAGLRGPAPGERRRLALRRPGRGDHRVRRAGHRRPARRTARQIPADTVVVGVGISPNVQLAEQAGLDVDNGIKVDAALRSSDPDIYAAGDVANAFHPLLGKHIRVEHWANALNQPQTAARSMLGQDVAFDRVPYFFTDQYDLGMEYAGYVEPGGYAQVVFRGDVPGREFVAFWLDGDGRVLAGNERQRLGRQRPDPGAGPVRPSGGPGRAARSGSAARVAGRSLSATALRGPVSHQHVDVGAG